MNLSRLLVYIAVTAVSTYLIRVTPIGCNTEEDRE